MLLELRQELEQAGYPARVEVIAPFGSAAATIEHIAIMVGLTASVGIGSFSKKIGEAAAEAVIARLSRKLPKTSEGSPSGKTVKMTVEIPEGQSAALLFNVNADNMQVENLQALTSDEVKRLFAPDETKD
jgi:hypothetical protein